MHTESHTIRTSLQNLATTPKDQAFIRRYLGTPRKVLGVKSADLRKIAHQIVKIQQNSKDMSKLLGGLYAADTFEERALAGHILGESKSFRSSIPLKVLGDWIGQQQGWAEIDITCQSCFTANEVLHIWDDWKIWIRSLSKSSSISHRRASLVLQVLSLRESSEEKIGALALEIVEVLKAEKDILITKAISWVLRSMVKGQREVLEKYLAEQGATLPKIALREVTRKLETGRK